MTSIAFAVRGLPVAQGSARAFIAKGRAIVATEGNRTRGPLGAWRTAIADEARRAMGTDPCLVGPVAVTVEFTFPRPRSHYLAAGRRRPVPELRLDAPGWHSGPPDADKLSRALLDALTLVVFRDDRQVAELVARKRYETPTRPPGALVKVETLQ
jgi:Holliday junction resolvase RusA-like endonuclease